MGVVLLIKGTSFKVTKNEYKMLCLLSIFYAATSMLLTLSYLYIPSGMATTIHFLYPLAVAVAMTLLFHERFSGVLFTAIVISLAGAVLLSAGEIRSEGGNPTIGIVAACFSVVSYAGYIIGVRKTRAAQVESTALTFLVMAIGAVLFAVAGSLTTGLHAVTEGRTWGNILGLALPATAISNIALVKAIKAIGPTLSSILGALEPLTAVAIGVLYFGEPLTIAGIAGMALVIIAVMIVVIYDGKRPTATTPIPPASEL